MKRLFSLLLILLMLLSSACAEADGRGPLETYVRCVAGGSINLRAGPGTDHEKLGIFPRAAYGKLIDSVDGWHLIDYSGRRAWVSADYTELCSLENKLESALIREALNSAELCPALGSAAARSDDPLYAYSVPGASEPIGQLDAGKVYPVYEQRYGYLRVLDFDSYVWVNADTMNLTIADSLALNDDFHFRPIEDDIKARINGLSYKSYCTVPYEDLRYLSILYYDFEGNIKQGEIICNAAAARDLLVIFNVLYQAKYPLTEVSLVDKYNAEDRPSMSANNTSCFNFRVIAGTDQLSNHALGLAIDVNPRINPYVQGDYFSPKNAGDYADRMKDFEGKIDASDLSYQLFMSYGWEWGGAWDYAQDYQHFEKYLD